MKPILVFQLRFGCIIYVICVLLLDALNCVFILNIFFSVTHLTLKYSTTLRYTSNLLKAIRLRCAPLSLLSLQFVVSLAFFSNMTKVPKIYNMILAQSRVCSTSRLASLERPFRDSASLCPSLLNVRYFH